MRLSIFALVAGLAAVNAAGRWFDRILVINFENHSEREVLADPNFYKFAQQGQALMSFFAVTHPSQPNYWAQVAGDHFGINDDSNHDLPQTSLADLLEARNVPWKLYQQDYPGGCRTDAKIGRYVRKHNPFISFLNVQKNATRCAKILNSDALDTDLDAGTLPNGFMYFTPNMDNCGHDTSVAYAGKWLDGYLTPRLHKFPKGTLIVITWDEDDYTENNQILTVLLDPHGTIVKPRTADRGKYNHYSLLKTIEMNFNLGTLGRNDGPAIPFSFNSTVPLEALWKTSNPSFTFGPKGNKRLYGYH